MKDFRIITIIIVTFILIMSFSTTSATVSRIAGASRLTSIALTDQDLPVVAHYDNLAGALDLVICQNIACTNRVALVLDSAGNVGSYPSIVLRNNIPLISYFDDTNDDLKLAICNDVLCSAPTLKSIATTGSVGRFTSLQLNSMGFPVITYDDNSLDLVRLLVCQDLDCTAPPLIYDIASTAGSLGATTALQIRSDNTAIIAYITSANGLFLATCQISNCNATLTNNNIDTFQAGFPFLVLDSNDFPALGYRNSGAGFRVARCNTLDCSGIPTITTLSSGDPILNVGFALNTNDIPTVTFSTITETSIAFCSTATCTAPTIEVIQSGLTASDSMDFVFDSDDSPIATYNIPTTNLQYYVLLPIASALPPIGSTITLTGNTGTTQSTTISITNIGEARSRLDLEQIGTLTNFSLSTLPDNLTPADGTFDITISCTVPLVQSQETLTLQSDENNMPTYSYTLQCVSNNPATPTPAINAPQSDNSEPQQGITIFDPAISKIGFLQPGQIGVTGERIEWIVTVSNTSSIAAQNVVVTDAINPNLSIINVQAENATVVINQQLVSVTYGRLEPFQTVQFSIFTTVLNGVEVNNTACVNSENQISEVCATSTIVSELPMTGETPLIRLWVVWIVALSLASAMIMKLGFYRRT